MKHFTLSLLLQGLTCHKALWLGLSDAKIADDINTQKNQYNQDDLIKPYKKALFSNGVFFNHENLTKEWLSLCATPSVFFDCTLKQAQFNVVYDILEKNENGLHLILFRASIGIKRYHYY